MTPKLAPLIKGLLFFICAIAATHSTLAQETTFTGYFDKDKILDKITVYHNWQGNRFSQSHIICRFSSVRAQVVYDCTHNYSDFFFTCPIPAAVTHQKAFTEKLAHAVVPTAIPVTDSNALQWMADICNNKNDANLTSLTNFKSHFTLHWRRGLDGVFNACYTTNPNALPRCTYVDEEPSIKSKGRIYFYMGNNQSGVKQTIDIPGYQLIVTHHGVLLKKDEDYAWLFINELNTFGTGSEKLRWPSITYVCQQSNYLIIKTIAVPSEIESVFIICMDTWNLFRLKNNNHTSLQNLRGLCD